MKKFLLIFFLINLFLASFYLDVWINANTISRTLPLISYFENGSNQHQSYSMAICVIRACDRKKVKHSWVLIVKERQRYIPTNTQL